MQQLSELISHASFDGLEDIEAAICQFTDILKDAAAKTLPVKSYKKPHKWKDTTLSTLCAQSRAAQQTWKENGCPKEGPLYNEKGRLRRERLRYCAAQAENRRLLRRDKMFASSHPHRFKLLGHRKKTCSRLKVNDTIITDTPGLLETRADHFSSLAQSKITDNHGLAVLASDIESLVTSSMDNEDYILDVPFTVEEVENAIKRLKRKKAPGADNLLAEHLIEGGQCVVIYLTYILNAIIDLEIIPDSFKSGLVVPVYKGSGKDPLRADSYSGITLSPVFSKVLEFLILDRLELVFMEANVPHLNQSAYRKKISCADAIFATQEVIARYRRGGSRVFMCLYDLQKAFDSIEYPVLLNRLYDLGVHGKCWRIIKSWY